MQSGPYPYKTPRKVIRKKLRAATRGGYYLGSKGQPIGNIGKKRYGVYNSGDSRKLS